MCVTGLKLVKIFALTIQRAAIVSWSRSISRTETGRDCALHPPRAITVSSSSRVVAARTVIWFLGKQTLRRCTFVHFGQSEFVIPLDGARVLRMRTKPRSKWRCCRWRAEPIGQPCRALYLSSTRSSPTDPNRLDGASVRGRLPRRWPRFVVSVRVA